MPENTREDELFRKSTMTFGQHLEELRKCLFKSVGGLVIGFVLGLIIGDKVVQVIKHPLSLALDEYTQNEDVRRVEAETKRMKNLGAGRAIALTNKQIEDRAKNGLSAEVRYIDPAALLLALKRFFPEHLKNVELPQTQGNNTEAIDTKEEDAQDKKAERNDSVGIDSVGHELDNLIPVFLWHWRSEDPRVQIKSLATTEPFAVYIKASLLVGILLSSPWVFYQIWSFVAAGLYPNERHYVQMYLPFSIGLFLAGAAVAFFFVFAPVLKFLLSFNRMTGIAPEPRINEWLGFALILPVGFGIGFQLPLVMLFLERIGVFTVKGYLKQWRIAVLVIAVVAALITPPDPSSMLILATSLTLLYFGGILLCKLMPRKKSSSFELTTLD